MRSKRVLIVDDQADDREIFAAVLTHFGYTVDCAESGPGALERSRESPPDLILLDLWMPGMSGYEVLSRLRQERARWVPVVAVTASVLYPEKQRALGAGFAAFVAKPCQPRALVDVVRELIGEPSGLGDVEEVVSR